MTTRSESIPQGDLERQALEYALSELFVDPVKQAIFRYFEVKHQIAMNSNTPLTSREIASAMDAFFGSGSKLILDVFYKKLAEIRID